MRKSVYLVAHTTFLQGRWCTQCGSGVGGSWPSSPQQMQMWSARYQSLQLLQRWAMLSRSVGE